MKEPERTKNNSVLLGPEARLSRASCTALVNPDQTKFFWCKLKAGYGLK